MIIGLLWSFSILIGGVLATIILREFVFAIQSIGMLFLAIVSIIFVKDLPEVKKSKKSFKKYFGILGGGIKYVVSTKYLGLFIFGLCLLNAIWAIWSQMILFPMYFGYTGSDLGAGIFRFLSWINQSLTAGYAGKLSIKLNSKKIPWLEWIIMAGYFSFFAILIAIFPLENELNLLSIIMVLVVFALLDFCVNIVNILRQRFFLDMIPDSFRNSIYSLIPTISLILSAPTVIIAGLTIGNLGIPLLLSTMVIFGTFAVWFMFISFKTLPIKSLDLSLERN